MPATSFDPYFLLLLFKKLQKEGKKGENFQKQVKSSELRSKRSKEVGIRRVLDNWFGSPFCYEALD
jgi:hypothetical protein